MIGFDETELDEFMAGLEGFGMGGGERGAQGEGSGGNAAAPAPTANLAERSASAPKSLEPPPPTLPPSSHLVCYAAGSCILFRSLAAA